MRKIKAIIDTGFVNCIHEAEFEVDEHTTEEEIEELVQEILHDRISISWKERKKVAKNQSKCQYGTFYFLLMCV